MTLKRFTNNLTEMKGESTTKAKTSPTGSGLRKIVCICFVHLCVEINRAARISNRMCLRGDEHREGKNGFHRNEWLSLAWLGLTRLDIEKK